MPNDTFCCRPYRKEEVCSRTQAAKLVNVSDDTITTWCEQYGIGRKLVATTWIVSRPALAMLVDGDLEALDQYLKGDRRSPRVVAYFTLHGLGPVAAEMADHLERLERSEPPETPAGDRGAGKHSSRTLRAH